MTIFLPACWKNFYWDFHGGSATEINSETEEYDSEHASDADVSDVETGDQQTVLSDLDILTFMNSQLKMLLMKISKI